MEYIKPILSVIMPTYNQGAFIKSALKSLYAQRYQNWELIIINDGSTDYTEELLTEYLTDERIRCIKNETNHGLGYCLNKGILHALCDYICYLPSDDIYYADHLGSLLLKLEEGNAILCYAGVNYDYKDTSSGSLRNSAVGIIPDNTLQLVQVMHKKTNARWIEREELVTDDLNKMFWTNLSQQGAFAATGIVSCEWVDHPHQRHKIIQESNTGGIYLYKRYYNVSQPLKFQSTVGNFIDESDLYKSFQDEPAKPTGLKILIVGELAYNPERITALESLGHKLYGLWIENPHCYNAVGPLPFGNVTDIGIDDLQERIDEVKPDIIYALLNYQAVPLAHYVMRAQSSIPFVWHFKEGPFFCRSYGIWKELVELYYNADGRIYINPEIAQWYGQFIGDSSRPTHILDGDIPSGKWFSRNKSPLLSDTDGAIHTVASGRPYGLSIADVGELAVNNIHLHLYGDYTQSFWAGWIAQAMQLAPNHLHLHSYCKPENWVQEYSQYDAGWLHLFTSNNGGELLKCTWDDLNYPSRMCTLAAAGLPMLQKKNVGHLVASEAFIEKLGMGVFFDSISELAAQLRDTKKMQEIRASAWKNREQFSFDYHAQGLIDFFMKVIEAKKLLADKT